MKEFLLEEIMLGKTSRAIAPANIALIKYMGKADATQNVAANPSISMTLQNLHTVAQVWLGDAQDSQQWHASLPNASQLSVPILSAEGSKKVSDHLSRISEQAPRILARFGLKSCAGVLNSHAANSFPHGVGIASSASSFAAITLAAVRVLCDSQKGFDEHWKKSMLFRRAIADLARRGSGSACRSMLGPWVAWDADGIYALDSQLPPMMDLVLEVDSTPKQVSSTAAHHRVLSSPLWTGRTERASMRAGLVKAALGRGDLNVLGELAWNDALEMHGLFHTADQPFTYWKSETVSLLKWLSFESSGNAILTLDAGPNIHLICPSVQAPAWKSKILRQFPEIRILEDTQGSGARICPEVSA